ncbi:MAG: ABC-2 family transporter protein [Chlamydiae bacterium]|nr:ABC-2 family transporter protein [Chlamydiota bacterium]
MLSLYVKLCFVSLRSNLQHKASFGLLTLATFITTFIDIFVIWALFNRFKMVKGWTLFELMLILGIIYMGFAIAEAFARSFAKFSEVVKRGDFDRILLRPLGTLVQVATREIEFMKTGRFFLGLFILIYGCSKLKISLFSLHSVVIILSIVGTASLFYGIFVIEATLAFWTTESLEIMNITTYGGVQAGEYPMSIYNRAFRLFFTFVIPLSCVAYYPIAILLRHETFPFWVGCISPFLGIVFLFLSFKLWKIGVRRYHSTGS